MRHFTFLLLFCISSVFCTAQNFTLNQGYTNQKNYFSIIKFENYYGFIIVSVKIKGDNYRFLLDTGAPNCISKALQQKLNFKLLKKIPVSDSNGTTDTMSVLLIDQLEFGGISFYNTPALIVDNPVFIDCMKIDGFIGSNMLRNSIIRLSYADSSIILTDKIKKLNLSKKIASKMILTPFQSNPYITVRLLGDDNGEDMVLFDTGKRGFYDLADINYQTFKQHYIFNVEAAGFGRSSIGIHGDGKNVSGYRLQLPKMELNGETFNNISTETSMGEHSLIGHDILKYGNVTLDYKNKKFYFESFNDNIDLSEKNFPITPRVDDNKLFIGIIWGNDLKNSMQIGDQIIAIDGVNCEEWNICNSVSRIGFPKDKDKITLSIKNKQGIINDVIIEKK
jgi:Aspartyl protease